MRLALALFLCRALMQSQLKGLSQAVAVYNVVAVGARGRLLLLVFRFARSGTSRRSPRPA
jgi:hypothetical protein